MEESRILEEVQDNIEKFSEYALERMLSLAKKELEERQNFYARMVNSVKDMIERGEEEYLYKNQPYCKDKSELNISTRVCPNKINEILKIFKENDMLDYKGTIWLLNYDITYKDLKDATIQTIHFKIKKSSKTPLKI